MGQRRSFERRVRAWKRRHGTERELFFTQDHRPGERLQLDWRHREKLEIELGRADALIICWSTWSCRTPTGSGLGVCYSEARIHQERTAECSGRAGRSSRLLPEALSDKFHHQCGGRGAGRSGRKFNARYLGATGALRIKTGSDRSRRTARKRRCGERPMGIYALRSIRPYV